ncbi:MAG: hypothetical protein D6762_03800 [Candidatus Neomarinimicrobiota bacterium]|nr:MAG: hypothetical protein D6762_03800 [Candidatus Neomarinimicrobiota bacterium]
MNPTTVTGRLVTEGQRSYLLDEQGNRHFEDYPIWDGYIRHWAGKRVHGRLLPQKDYTEQKEMVILWPAEPRPEPPFVELYYNERLVKYMASRLGHNAINVDGGIYNFSHKLNENEIMTEEEYFYRPALGEFAPSPRTGMFEVPAEGLPYYDKFGRSFMRAIHVLEVKGLDTETLKQYLNAELQIIHATPPDPRRPAHYADFSIWTRSCSTIIRDCLQRLGYPKIKGIFPRDLFVSAAWVLQQDSRLRVRVYLRPQLLVPEAPPSVPGPFVNPANLFRQRQLNYDRP